MHFGICASYTEVRQFLTSAANHEIAKTEVSCIPYGISPKMLGGDFIQEGAENIDLNTETIDGKHTMHSMARAVFQVVQDHPPTSEISSTKIKTRSRPITFHDRGNHIIHGMLLILYCTSFFVT
jgi:hypothetical protein